MLLRAIPDSPLRLRRARVRALPRWQLLERVPADVRKQGPWQGNRHGSVEELKPEYRLALARDGYALVNCELAVFKPEA